VVTSTQSDRGRPSPVAMSGTPARPAAPKSLLDRRLARLGIRVAAVAVLVLAWQLASQNTSQLLLPSPNSVWRAGVAMVKSGELARAIGQSLQALAIGYLSAILVGLIVGILVGRFRFVNVATTHILNAFYVTPQLAFLPLVILWFGLGFQAKIVIIFLVSVFPVLFNTADGMGQVSSHHVEVARSYGANEIRVLREVTMPSILPSVMTGVRLAAGRALTGMIVAEFFTSISGLGGILVTAGNQLDTARVFVPIFVLAVLGVAIIQGGRAVENRLVGWKKTEKAF